MTGILSQVAAEARRDGREEASRQNYVFGILVGWIFGAMWVFIMNAVAGVL